MGLRQRLRRLLPHPRRLRRLLPRRQRLRRSPRQPGQRTWWKGWGFKTAIASAAASVLVAMLLAPVRGAVSDAWHAIFADTTKYGACPSSYFCVFDADGRMCKWKDNSSDWYAQCSWARSRYPKYVYNHGKSGLGVRIYRHKNYEGLVEGCIAKGEKVTLAGDHHLRSHKWSCGSAR